MIYIKDNKGTATLVPAGVLKVGDVLVSDSAADEYVIQLIVTVERTGVYAPFTYNGNIVVNAVVVSNYITLVGLPKNTPTWLHVWMSHAATVPRRIMCRYNIDWCRREETTYNDEGYASWMEPLLYIYEFVTFLFTSLPQKS
jgi:hypothetical protein